MRFDFMEKRCSKCHEVKPFSDFHNNSSNKYGKASECKECKKKSDKQYRLNNVERLKKYEQSRHHLPHRVKSREEWAKTEKGLIGVRRRGLRYYYKNRKKCSAINKVNCAIRDGKLTKGSCRVCNKNEGRIEGHHNDYSKPLDVIWLCHKHHRYHHKIMGHKPFDIRIFEHETDKE